MGKGKKEKRDPAESSDSVKAGKTKKKAERRSASGINEEEIIRSKDIRQKMNRRKVSKVVAVFLAIALAISGTAWGVLSIVDANSMRIRIGKGVDGLSLSTEQEFGSPTTTIKMPGPEEMRDITYLGIDVPKTVMGQQGSHNGEYYIGYSFFLKNISPAYACYYRMSMSIRNKTRMLDEAIRVMVVYTDEAGDYSAKVFAKARADGSPEAIAYDSDQLLTQQPISVEQLNRICGDTPLFTSEYTEPFLGKVEGDDTDYIDLRPDLYLHSGRVVKYTVVIWIEGSDAQCVDESRGGYVSLSLQFDLLGYDESSYDPAPDPFH